MDLASHVDDYLEERSPTARYSSFDYCFNHFQSRRDANRLQDLASADLELTCLHLGFYLASWGMLRGSSVLLRRSMKHYVPVVEVIASSEREVWEIDTHIYTPENIELILDVARRLRTALPERASDILITKIMLGTFGCVPALDTYFKKGLGVSTLGRKSLRKIAGFYEDHEGDIESHRVPTLDFATGAETTRLYPRAKVIDMAFFMQRAR